MSGIWRFAHSLNFHYGWEIAVGFQTCKGVHGGWICERMHSTVASVLNAHSILTSMFACVLLYRRSLAVVKIDTPTSEWCFACTCMHCNVLGALQSQDRAHSIVQGRLV